MIHPDQSDRIQTNLKNWLEACGQKDQVPFRKLIIRFKKTDKDQPKVTTKSLAKLCYGTTVRDPEKQYQDFKKLRNRLKSAASAAGVYLHIKTTNIKGTSYCYIHETHNPQDELLKKGTDSATRAHHEEHRLESASAITGSDKEVEHTLEAIKKPLIQLFVLSDPDWTADEKSCIYELKTALKTNSDYRFKVINLPSDLGESTDSWQLENLLKSHLIIHLVNNHTLAHDSQAHALLCKFQNTSKLTSFYIPIITNPIDENAFKAFTTEALQSSDISTDLYTDISDPLPHDFPTCWSQCSSPQKEIFIQNLHQSILLKLQSHSLRTLEEDSHFHFKLRVRNSPLDIQSEQFQEGSAFTGNYVSQHEKIEADTLSKDDVKPALEYLYQWSVEKAGRHSRLMAVLGEYGMGKTTHIQMLCQKLQAAHSDDPSIPFPIYLDLRHPISSMAEIPTLQEILTHCLAKFQDATSQSTAIDPDYVIQLVRDGKAIAFFDGLDEQILSIHERLRPQFFDQLKGILPKDTYTKTQKEQPGRWFVSCRNHYFETFSKQREVLGSDRESDKISDYDCCLLLPFSSEQIHSYLEKNIPDTTLRQQAVTLIETTHKLSDLAARPYLLSLIIESIGSLVEKQLQGSKVYAADLYQSIIDRWLTRDTGKHLLSELDKLTMMGDLAHALWENKQREWNATKLNQWIQQWSIQAAQDNPFLVQEMSPDTLNQIIQDIRTASFIVRPANEKENFRFAHTSMQEFFLALTLFRELGKGNLAILDIPQPSRETWSFFGQLLLIQEEDTITIDSIYASMNEALACYQPRITRNALEYIFLATEEQLPYPELEKVSLIDEEFDHTHWKKLSIDHLCIERCLLWQNQWSDMKVNTLELIQTQARQLVCDSSTFLSLKLEQADITSSRWSDCYIDQHTISKDSTLAHTHYVNTSAFDTHSTTIHPPTHPQAPSLSKSSGHDSSITHVAFSNNDQWIVTASNDHSAIIWNAENGKPIHTLKKHSDTIRHVAFSNNDQWIVTASFDNSAIIWNAENGKPIHTLKKHSDTIRHVAFSNNDQWIVTASDDNSAIIWNAQNGKPIHTLKKHSSWINHVAFSNNDQWIVTASLDNSAIIWNAENGKPIHTLNKHSDWINHVAFSNNDQWIVTASDDKSAIIWNAENGKPIHTLKKHSRPIRHVTFSNNDQWIVTASDDKSAIIWNAENGKPIHTLKKHSSLINHVAFSNNDQWIVTASRDKSAIIWNAENGKPIHTLNKHSSLINHVAFSNNDQWIVTASRDKSAIIWNAENGNIEEHYDSIQKLPQWAKSLLNQPPKNQVTTHGAEAQIEGVSYFHSSSIESSCAVNFNTNEVLFAGTHAWKTIHWKAYDESSQKWVFYPLEQFYDIENQKPTEV